MSEPALGRIARHGPFPGHVDSQRISAYAAAIGDESTLVLAGAAVPAVFPVVLAFDAQEAANGDVPPTVWHRPHAGVHGAHDMVLHRPLLPDEALDTWSHVSAIRTTRAGTQVVLRQAGVTSVIGLDIGVFVPRRSFPKSAVR